MPDHRYGTRVRHVVASALAALLVSGGVACHGILDVTNPQAFGSKDLDNPAILKNVADGAETLLHQTFDEFIIDTDLLGDQLESTSTWIDWEDMSEGRIRGDWPNPGAFSDAMDGILRARFAAQSATARVKRVLGEAANSNVMLPQLMWVDGMADLLLGMSYCEGPLVANGPRVPDSEMIKQSVTKLTSALQVAQAQNNADWTNAIRASRARAKLFSGDYDGALADALATPPGFVKFAVFSEAGGLTTTTQTGNQLHQNRNRSGGLRRMYQSRVHEVDPVVTGEAYMRDWFDPTKDDHRIALTRFTGQLGVNNRIQFYGITKYADRSTDIPMVTAREMNLIAAEVYWHRGNYASEAASLNIDRVAVGLPPIPPPASAADGQAALLNERFAILFVEGQRLNDLARFGDAGLLFRILGDDLFFTLFGILDFFDGDRLHVLEATETLVEGLARSSLHTSRSLSRITISITA